MLKKQSTYADLCAGFAWDIPEFYNVGADACDRVSEHAPDAPAIIDVTATGTNVHSFADLKSLSNRYANVLSQHAERGDRIAVLLPQRVETAAAHIAITKMGCIALPLTVLFGPDALSHRLGNSEAVAVITDLETAPKVLKLREDLPALHALYTVDGAIAGTADLTELSGQASDTFEPVETTSDDPAFLIYTSGTTGPPKGALHGHRVLLGHLPGVEMSHDFLPQPNDKIWTPADWAWIGGLLDVLFPALHHGIPVVAHRFDKFTGEAAFDFIETHSIRNAFLPPTALKLMRQATNQRPLAMRSVASGGETLGKELIAWGQATFGTTINEFYGQTECNMIVSSCAAIAQAEPGVMGFPVPGHQIEVLTDAHQPCAQNEIGAIAVKAPDPVMFLGYWQNAQATQDKFVYNDDGQWLLTGDTGLKTTSGRIQFVGRDDDVINSAGYRIGPGEIEDCLLTHPAVQLAGVVGASDETRGERVVAFVRLADGHAESEALALDIQSHVKSRLAAYEYPREVHFIYDMPMTTTGKIIRAELRAQLRK